MTCDDISARHMLRNYSRCRLHAFAANPFNTRCGANRSGHHRTDTQSVLCEWVSENEEIVQMTMKVWWISYSCTTAVATTRIVVECIKNTINRWARMFTGRRHGNIMKRTINNIYIQLSNVSSGLIRWGLALQLELARWATNEGRIPTSPSTRILNRKMMIECIQPHSSHHERNTIFFCSVFCFLAT